MDSLTAKTFPTPGSNPHCVDQAGLGVLRLKWASSATKAARTFLASLASLVFDEAESLILDFATTTSIDDLEPAELAKLLTRTVLPRLRFQGGVFRSPWAIEVEDDATVKVRIGLIEWPIWLQAIPEIPSSLKLLTMPPCYQGNEIEVSHALVGLAGSCGDLESAQWFAGQKSHELPDAEWSQQDNVETRLMCVNDGAVWFVDHAESAGDSARELAFVDHRKAQQADESQDRFLVELAELLSKGSPDWEKVTRCSSSVIGGRTGVSISPINLSTVSSFRTPLQEDRVLVIIPEPNRVVIEVDENQPADMLALAVAHGLAHVALGHVGPGDEYGHWDTAETLKGGQRRWDREVNEAFPAWFGAKRIESVEDLNARDKALLGLWRMIHETLGESSKLHPRAERYQRAAYQRQAAERLLAQLQQYGGAMLCDGVGLGKTYVATTLMVHCANAWQNRLAEPAKSGAAESEPDLFRITILAPNSVVSTWQREAIPPLYAYGVLPASIRVISHSRLSRLSSTSEVIAPVGRNGFSDLEHLILSDLVIVDEAHNFRSADARRSFVLRDLLRLQPRDSRQKELRRKVVLLTATPVNNSLEDLRQQAALLFSNPTPLSTASTVEGYRRQAFEEIRKRARKARTPSADRGNVAALMIHGDGKTSFSKRLEFRDDLDFGTRVQRIGDYLNEQDKKLKDSQDKIRDRATSLAPDEEQEQSTKAVRVAEELLDRIVVQRSRALCKAIEREAGSTAEILFRPDAAAPEKLHYSDEYDGISDVLAGFLPLFDRSLGGFGQSTPSSSGIAPLSLRIYMWYDVREGIKAPTEYSPVVGLQRALVLKRLESSPVSLLITLLRLTVFHAFRLQQLTRLCQDISDLNKARQLQTEIDALVGAYEKGQLEKIGSLATGETADGSPQTFLERLARSHQTLRPTADSDDSPTHQLTLDLYGDGEVNEETQLRREEIDRLWGLKEALLEDFGTLLKVTPGLADIVFGRFARSEWPRKFIAGGLLVDWPTSSDWGQRIVTDAKIRRLFARLVEARRLGQKAIVFSQFSDSLAYIHSVLQACRAFNRQDWALVVRGLGVADLHADELIELLDVTEVITGDSEDRDSTVNAFAPYYRIGPFSPSVEGASLTEAETVVEDWRRAWRGALERPIDVLLATDILAEGVNLQDAALLINFDIHWNPVRMIQRSGRIDRRLNPRIEHLAGMPEVEAIAAELNKPVPRYYWHGRHGESPLTVNMILPDALEKELLLRERIAIKTLAIDFTLGLDQGTGAEADWMASYKFQGISSLNSFDKDRAIEQIAGYHEKLSRDFHRRGIDREWSQVLNVWIRQSGGHADMPLVARASVGQKSGAIAARLFSRYLEPSLKDGIPCWLWSEEKPRNSLLNQWLVLDAKTFPPRIEKTLPWKENASTPLSAHHLLAAIRGVVDGKLIVEELPLTEVGRPLQQGITAVSAGYFGDDDSRRNVKVESFFLLQLETFEDRNLSA